MRKKSAMTWIAAALIFAPILLLTNAAGGIGVPAGAQAPMVPIFEADPFWPKPLPNNQIIGWVMGISVDAKDNVWVMQRADVIPLRTTAAKPLTKEELAENIRMAVPRTIKGRAGLLAEWMKTAVRTDGRCCSPVPEILLAYDQQGNVVKRMLPYFGGMQNGYEMFDFPHGVTVDYKGNVWVGNNTAEDSRLVKFDQNGKYTASGFLDSGLTVFASTPPRPARGGRVAPGPGFGSRTSPASTARCTSA